MIQYFIQVKDNKLSPEEVERLICWIDSLCEKIKNYNCTVSLFGTLPRANHLIEPEV